MGRASCIKDSMESTYVYGANEPFAPKYPVFKFPTSRKTILIKSYVISTATYIINILLADSPEK